MNRLVIIGNGFDLSHGLKTRYSDFMLSHLKASVSSSYQSRNYSDDLLSVTCKGKFTTESALPEVFSSINTLAEFLEHGHISHNLKGTSSSPKMFNIKVASTFLIKLLSQYDIPRWVDIETEYFAHLREILSSGRKTDVKVKLVIALNTDLNRISDLLKDYLKTVCANFSFQAFQQKQASKLTQIRDFLFSSSLYGLGDDGQTGNAMLVNYNYTPIAFKYMALNTYQFATEFINLHGTLSEDDDRIFGYGHVPGSEYDEVQEFTGNEAMKGLKQFNYHLKSEETKLKGFLRRGMYDVFILGHSCGPSDGTTLQRIFDSEQCRKIFVCHIDRDEFQTKTMDIKRHSPTEVVHDKIQPFNPNLAFPK